MNRIVFFDGPCPLCNWVIRWLMQADKKCIFMYAPLQGKTAEEKNLPKDRDSMVLLEDGKNQKNIYFSAKCVMKIFWLLGGKYRLIGWMYFMPKFLMDPWYRFVARNRYRLFVSKKTPHLESSRLLP
jgi:predicted DCC family thiol-disulfide oxidoreductase YuxK